MWGGFKPRFRPQTPLHSVKIPQPAPVDMALELQHDLASAVVDSVLEDAFPDRDELALAPLTAALPEIRRALQASGAQITVSTTGSAKYHSSID